LEIRWQLLIDSAVEHGASMYRRLVAEEVGNYRDDTPVAEDYALWSAVARRYPMANLPQVLLRRRVHRWSISSVRRREQELMRWKIARENHLYLEPDIHEGLDVERMLPALWALWFMRPDLIATEDARAASQLAWRLRREFARKCVGTGLDQLYVEKWCRDWLFQRLPILLHHLVDKHHWETARFIVEDTRDEIQARAVAGSVFKPHDLSDRQGNERPIHHCQPLVSIIIPTYNDAEFVGSAVQSALEQDYSNVEVIVIDDGSTDNTREVLSPFLEDQRVRGFFQENRGPSAARNRGIAESRGEYLNFLDADDYLHPSKIAKQVHILESEPSVDLVYCDVAVVDRNGDTIEEYSVGASRKILDDDIFDSLMLGGYFPPHVVLLRRRVLDQVGGFDQDLRCTEDLDLWLRASAEGIRARYVDEKLAYYRRYPGTVSQDEPAMQRAHAVTLERIASQYPARVARSVLQLLSAREDLYAASKWLATAYTELMEPYQELKEWAGGLEQYSKVLRDHALSLEEGQQELRKWALGLEQDNQKLSEWARGLEEYTWVLRQRGFTLEEDQHGLKEWALGLERDNQRIRGWALELRQEHQKLSDWARGLEEAHEQLAQGYTALRTWALELERAHKERSDWGGGPSD
jgi:glycosyltransferase involved in cell wall biosynthesis